MKNLLACFALICLLSECRKDKYDEARVAVFRGSYITVDSVWYSNGNSTSRSFVVDVTVDASGTMYFHNLPSNQLYPTGPQPYDVAWCLFDANAKANSNSLRFSESITWTTPYCAHDIPGLTGTIFNDTTFVLSFDETSCHHKIYSGHKRH